jgi:hypothetical protein
MTKLFLFYAQIMSKTSTALKKDPVSAASHWSGRGVSGVLISKKSHIVYDRLIVFYRHNYFFINSVQRLLVMV